MPLNIETQSVQHSELLPLSDRRVAFAARLSIVKTVDYTPEGALVRGICSLTGQPVQRLIQQDGDVLEWEEHAWRWVHIDEGFSADYRNARRKAGA